MGWWTAIQILVAIYSGVTAYKANQRAKQAAQKQKPQGVEITRYGTDNAIPVVLGRRKLSPTIVFQNVNENPNRNNDIPNERYYAILVWAIGELEEIEQIYFDDQPIEDFDFNPVNAAEMLKLYTNIPGATGGYYGPTGGDAYYEYLVNNPPFSLFKGPWSQIVETLPGTDNQEIPQWFKDNVDEDLTGMNFNGLAVSFVFLEKDVDFNTYPNGVPEFSAIVKGKKIPDLSTGTTHATSNFASQVYWYLTNDDFGLNLPAADLDINQITQMAKFGDIDSTTDQGPVNRLESNIVIDTSRPAFDVLEEWLKDFNCFPIPGDNGLRLEIGRERILNVGGVDHYADYINGILTDTGKEVLHLDESHIIGGIRMATGNIEDKANQATVRYYDQNNRFTTNEVVWPKPGVIYPNETTALYDDWLAEDGKLLSIEDDLTGITSKYHAEQYAELLVKSSRQADNLEIKVSAIGYYLEPFDIVSITSSRRGWDKKLFEVRTIKEMDDGFKLGLLEYKASNYAWSDKATSADYSETTLANPFLILPPTNLQITNENKKVKFNWTHSDSFRTGYQIEIFNGENTLIKRDIINVNEYIFSPLVADDYSVVITTKNNHVLSTALTGAFSTETPVAPAIGFDAEALSIQVYPVYTGIYANVNFELLYNSTNDQNTAINAGTSNGWTITGLTAGTTYYFWLRTIGVFANSEWVTASTATTTDVSNIIGAVDGKLEISHLSQAAQDTIDTLQRDITSNFDANAATSNALQMTNAAVATSSTAYQSAFATVVENINDNILFREELLGYKAQVTVLEDQVTVNATNIEQTATKIELSAVKAELKGDITNIATGDIDAIVDAAIGDLTGRVETAEFFIGTDNLDGVMTIGSYLDEVFLDKDFATISHVSQEITALGIENYVTQTELTTELTTVNAAVDILSNNYWKQAISSFSVNTANAENMGQQMALINAQAALNDLSLLDENIKFKGALAATDDSVTALSTETSAEVERINSQFARVDENISIAYEAINTVVNENQITATKIEELSAADETNLAEAKEFTRATVGYCVDENGNVTNDIDKATCLLTAGNQWLNLPLSEAIEQTSITVTNPDGSETTATTKSLVESLKTEDSTIASRIDTLESTTETTDGAVTALTTRVGQVETDSAGNASAIENLQTNVSTATSTANSALTLATTADAKADTVSAEAFLSVDVNGRIAGVKASVSDTEPSILEFLGDKIRFLSPDGTLVGLEWDATNNKFLFSGAIYAKEIIHDIYEVASKDLTPDNNLNLKKVNDGKTVLGKFTIDYYPFKRTITIDPLPVVITNSGDAVTIELRIFGANVKLKTVSVTYHSGNNVLMTPPLTYELGTHTGTNSTTLEVVAYTILSGGETNNAYIRQGSQLTISTGQKRDNLSIT